MKKFIFLSIGLALLPWTLSAQVVEDDLYYTPKKSKQTITATETTAEEEKVSSEKQINIYAPNATAVVVRDKQGTVRDVDEYNRHYTYTSKQNDFSIENDTLYIDEREDSDLTGEWVNGFDGSEEDYEYAVRLIRFRNPRYAIPVSSPLYWDIVYGQNYLPWDWNVYYDGLYAYIFPTTTNWYWWNWRYNSWSYWRWYYWDYHPYYSWYWGGWYHHHPYYANHWRPGRDLGRWGGPDRYRNLTAQRGHDRSSRYNSGAGGLSTRSVAGGGHTTRTSVSGANTTRSRYTGTRVSQSDRTTTKRATGTTGTGRVQGYSNSLNRRSVNTASVRPTNGSTTRNSQGQGAVGTTTRSRSTSSYVRPNTGRPGSNTYSRPSSTRSTDNYNSSNTRSYNSGSSGSGSSVRSSNFSGGGNGYSSGNIGGGGSRSGGGGSRR